MQLRLSLHYTGQQHIHTGRHFHARHSEPPWRLGDMDCMLLDSVFLPPLARFIHNHRTVDCDVCSHVLAVRSAWMEERFHAGHVMLTTSCTHALEMAAYLCEIEERARRIVERPRVVHPCGMANMGIPEPAPLLHRLPLRTQSCQHVQREG